jgi:hypothetical protein
MKFVTSSTCVSVSPSPLGWPGPRIGESSVERGGCAGGGVLRYAGVEVRYHVTELGERAVVEEGAGVLELTHGQAAELVRVARVL